MSPLADTPVDELARLPFHLFRLSLHVCVYICARCAPGFGISFPSDARCPLWPFFLLSLSFFLSEANVCPSQARRKREAFSTRRNPLIIQGKRIQRRAAPVFPQLWTRLVPAAGPRPFLALPPSTFEGFQRKPRLVCTPRINTGLVESGGEGEGGGATRKTGASVLFFSLNEPPASPPNAAAVRHPFGGILSCPFRFTMYVNDLQGECFVFFKGY